jgi:hypothetical protein
VTTRAIQQRLLNEHQRAAALPGSHSLAVRGLLTAGASGSEGITDTGWEPGSQSWMDLDFVLCNCAIGYRTLGGLNPVLEAGD